MRRPSILLITPFFWSWLDSGFCLLKPQVLSLPRVPQEACVWQGLKSRSLCTRVSRASWASPLRTCLGGWGQPGQATSSWCPPAVGLVGPLPAEEPQGRASELRLSPRLKPQITALGWHRAHSHQPRAWAAGRAGLLGL